MNHNKILIKRNNKNRFWFSPNVIVLSGLFMCVCLREKERNVKKVLGNLLLMVCLFNHINSDSKEKQNLNLKNGLEKPKSR
jgi:hypothetical protein